MLVHIPTMGCLVSVWTGKYETICNEKGFSIQVPVYEKCTFNNTYLEHPENWQEIPTKSTLGKKLIKYYPDVTPVFDENGVLIDITITKLEENKKKLQQERKEKKEQNKKRGYANRANLRPKNLLPFLQVD